MAEPAEGRARGKCLCGAVQFDVLVPVKWCAHCHCSICRRAHGAALVTWLGVERDGFRLLKGKDELVRYRSSDAAERSFCRICGSSMFFEGQRWADEIHVARALFDSPLSPPPLAHVFFDSGADWLSLDHLASLPKMGGPTGTEPLQ